MPKNFRNPPRIYTNLQQLLKRFSAKLANWFYEHLKKGVVKMENFTLSQLVSAVRGILVGDAQTGSSILSHVDIDSRAIHKNSVFFALVGDRFDGHNYLEQAVEQGAIGCVISQNMERYPAGAFFVLVEDTQKALGDLAKWYASLFDIPKIAVTGSVGKTTAKDMIASVLSTQLSVLKTEGNFNNGIGVPLTLFRLTNKHQVCVVEMGMDSLGDIDMLGEMVKPEVAVLTNIGDAHVERLGSRENIFKAKSEILSHISSDGMVILNGDDPFLKQIQGDFQIISVGRRGERLQETSKNMETSLQYQGTLPIGDGTGAVTFSMTTPKENCKVKVPAMGDHMIYPVLLAVGVAEYLGLSLENILKGVLEFVPSQSRMQQTNLPREIILLDDTYNASPSSMEAGIGVLANYDTLRKVAVLGDMLELGEFSQRLHHQVGIFVASKKIDLLVTVGEKSRWIAEGAKEAGMRAVVHCETKNEAKSVLLAEFTDKTVFFMKASRGMALEELVEFVQDSVK